MTPTPASGQQPPLTLEQALSLALEHHQSGQAQSAEQLYRAILQASPQHAEAQHKLGILALQFKQAEVARSCFQAALASDPRQSHYWLSYLDSLQQTGQTDLLQQELARAHACGASDAVIEALARSLTPAPARINKRQGKAAAAPRAQTDQLLLQFNAGRYLEAARQAHTLCARFAQDGFSWKLLGAALKKMGQPASALAALQQAAALMPADVETHNILGNTLRDLGQLEQARASLMRALKLRPDYAVAHNNLGLVLLEQAQPGLAEASFRQALRLQPDLVEAHNNLGNALRRLERSAEAEACFIAALALRPDYAEACSNLGHTLLQQGRYPEAETQLRRALALQPSLPDAWRGLGHALHSQDRAAEAEGCFRRALEIQPNHSQALLELGQVLLQLWRPAEAEPLLRRAIELQPDFAQAYSSLGSCLAEQGLLQQAEACYRRAIALAPDYAASYSNLGSLLMDFGHLAQAQQALTRAIELDPAAAAPLANALLYLPYRRDDAHFQQLDTLYAQRQTLTRQDRILLNFAMGRAMEQSGEYPRAFAAFAEGNRLCHETRPYDQAGHARLVDSSRAFYSAQLFDACSAAQTSLADLPDARVPVFIVGMPRAGSTLIEQILASHPALHGAGELPLIAGMVEQAQQLLRAQPQPQQALGALRQLGRDYLEQLWQRAPQATHISDKMPENYLHLGLIRLMLPQARIIHALRDPMDTCFSCYALLFKYRHEFSYDMTTLGNYFLAYQTLMRHWHQTLPKGWIVDAHYEDTVADPERQARRLLAHLDLPWDDACLNFHESRRTVQTASVAQVRQPIYSTSIARWRHFEAYLEPLRQIIQA